MSNRTTGSITKNKDRYNDDFYLEFDGVDDTGKVSSAFSEVSLITDWSVSFSLIPNSNTSNYVIASRDVGFNGWSVLVND